MDNLDKIFRAYDIRGIYPKEINEEIAYKIGNNIGSGVLIVAKDNRPSSNKLSKAIIKGANDAGVNVIDIGLSTSPMFYFAVKKLKASGGIMITASHNSEKYNGFKIVKNNALPINNNILNKIKQNIKNNHKLIIVKKKGITTKKNVLKDYVKQILNLTHTDKIDRFKVAVEAKNKMAISIVSELDKNLKKLSTTNLFSKADLGIVFDSDGDRIFFIDENGRKIDPDVISAIIIHYYFKSAGRILCTVASSRIVKQEAVNNGNKIVLSRIGHSFIKKIMAREKIVFSSEASGHYCFKGVGYFEAPLLIFIRIMEVLSKVKSPLSKLVEKFDNLYRERINIKIKNIKKSNLLIKNIENKYKKTSHNGQLPKISHIDGLTMEYDNWWFNLRTSNTEPVLRLTIEADTKELLVEQKQKLFELIEK